MKSDSVLEDVVSTMQRLDSGEIHKLAKEDLERWMTSDDIQVMGAAHYILFDNRYYPKIVPPLTFDDYETFVRAYYERCLLEDPQLDWCDTRYTAAWDLVGWFMGLWKDKQIPRDTLGRLKEWIASLYKAGGGELRDCLITATLEHLFEDRKVAAFFSDWRDDDTLRIAYDDALSWSARGGRSDLASAPKKRKNR